MSAVIMARLLPKAARGERDRVCHLFPLPDDDEVPDRLRALCGVEIRQGDAELLPGLQGMPCFTCVASSHLAPAESSRQVDGDGWHGDRLILPGQAS